MAHCQLRDITRFSRYTGRIAVPAAVKGTTVYGTG